MRVEPRLAVAQLDLDQREVGGAAADVADQHEPRVGELRGQRVAMTEQPVVERRLRLFEQAQRGQAGRRARLPASARAPPRRTTPAPSARRPAASSGASGKRVVPRRAHVREVARARGDRRDLAARRRRRPTAGSARARSTAACDSQLFALATSRPGTCAPSSRARLPITTGAAVARLRRATAAADRRGAARPAPGDSAPTAAAAARPTSPGATSCSIVEQRGSACAATACGRR